MTFALLFAFLFVPLARASHSQLDLVSTGPNPGNPASDAAFVGASQDGTHVFFQTRQSLVSADSDSSIDVYDRSAGATTLLSTGIATGNGPYDAYFQGASADGTHVFFETREQLVTTDHDSSQDVYERSSGSTKLLSTAGVGANGPFDARFVGASQDGTRVFFETNEPLAGGDADTLQDVYQRSGSATTLISTGPNTPPATSDAFFEAASADGAHVFFSTEEQLVGSDADGSRDVYERFGGSTTLVSTASGVGTADVTAFFSGISQDGTRVFFQTREALSSGDTDSSSDVYQRFGGSTTRISTGPAGGNGDFDAHFDGASADGTHVFFETLESLTNGDSDTFNDIYDRSGGSTTLVSTGPDGGNGDADAYFQAASQDGTHVFFDTAESLVDTDADSSIDLYERSGGSTKWVSTGTAGGNAALDADFAGISRDGTRVFFSTRESLVGSDTDSGRDLYERSRGLTLLISTGSGTGNGGPDAFFQGASDNGSAVFFDSDEGLLAADTDGFQDVYVVSERPYTYPVGASPTRVPFVPAFQPCTAGPANGTHNAPLSGASCSPPAPSSSLVAVGSRSLAFVRFKVLAPGACAPFDSNACHPDFTISVSATDIRSGSPSGPDYDTSDPGGRDLTLTATLPGAGGVGEGFQLTDKYNQPGSDAQAPYDKSATVVPLRVPISLNCTPTADATLGSTCSVQTTVNTLMPGAAVLGNRAIWEMGQLGLFDRGANGVVGDADDKLFEVQGLFEP